MRVVVSGGGTGGHFFPALAFSQYLKSAEPGVQVYFMGSSRGVERKIISDYRKKDMLPWKEVFLLESEPFVRSHLKKFRVFSLIRMGFKNYTGYRKAFRLLKAISPDFVLTFGGYASFPVAAASIRQKVPLFLHEQNTYAGLTNRLFAGYARKIFLSFPENYTRGFSDRIPREKFSFVGLPIRQEVCSWNRITRSLAFEAIASQSGVFLDESKPVLLVIGGSGGASFLNDFIMTNLEKLIRRFQIVWITGSRDYPRVRNAVVKKEDSLSGVVVFPFLENPGVAYRVADVALSRSGASVLFELLCFGVPAVFVPYPYASYDHQYHNAVYLKDTVGEGIEIVRQEEATFERVFDALNRVLEVGKVSLDMPEPSGRIFEEIKKNLS